MNALWLVEWLVVSVLLSGAGFAIDRIAALNRWPRRWGWAAAMGASVMLPCLAVLAPGLLPSTGWLYGGSAGNGSLLDGLVWEAMGAPAGAASAMAGATASAGSGAERILIWGGEQRQESCSRSYCSPTCEPADYARSPFGPIWMATGCISPLSQARPWWGC